MDYTLVDANTATMYMRFLRREGLATRRAVARVMWWSIRYRLGLLDLRTVVGRIVADAAGDLESETRERCERWYVQDVRRFVAPAGRAAVERHRALGHTLVLLTGNSPYISAPLAADLGIEHVLCTRLEVDPADGRFTGRLPPPFAYGQGKVELAEGLAGQIGLDLSRSAFYTDSFTDMPMLLRVGEPIVVNPDARLAREATVRDWPVLRFKA